MKVFVVVLIVAAIVGGFVGGEVTDSTFSITGAVIGGVGLFVVLMSLGALFHHAEERKKKELTPEMRGVFDRMVGKDTSPGAAPSSQWSPRPFYENKTKEQTREWFSHVEPWNRLDQRILNALIERLHGNPMFELFVHVSQDLHLVPKYALLSTLFDKGVGDVAACPQIAGLLLKVGSEHREAVVRLMKTGQNTEPLRQHYSRAMDALEASIHVEPNLLPSYVELAGLKLLMGKKAEAQEFCRAGLEQIKRTKHLPLPSRPDMNIKGAAAEVEDRLKAIAADLGVAD